MTPFGYSLNASTIRGTPVLRQIQVAAEAGFGAIELWFADTDAHGSLKEIRSALDDSGLAVPTMIYFAGWFECPGSEWPRVKDEASRRLEQAATLGAKHLICSPPEGPADLAIGAGRYRELLEIGAKVGVTPAFEFLGFVKQYCTIESALEVLAISGGVTVLDPFHIFRGGGAVESVAKLRADQIAVSHFNDTVKTPPREQQHDPDRVMPGDGCFDLARYCELLRATGYSGWLSLELFREDLWARDPMEVARIGLEKMKQVVER
jgi:2-keto-myo-inositol isomerase